MALKEKIIKCFNSKAFSYQSTADVQPYVAERLAQRLLHRRANRILEIGCGTGFLSEYLIRFFPQAEIILTDIAPAMVDITRRRFAHLQNVRVALMDGEALETEGQFDLIVSSMTLHWFTDLAHSLQHIIRRLTPGGELLFTFLNKNSIWEWRSLFHQQNAIAPTPHFPDYLNLQKSIPDLQMEMELTRQRYQNSHSFLKTLKSIGAHATHASHVILSSGKLRRMMRRLDDASAEGVNISYEVVYGSYTKC